MGGNGEFTKRNQGRMTFFFLEKLVTIICEYAFGHNIKWLPQLIINDILKGIYIFK